MTCEELELALDSGDPSRLEAARAHADMCPVCAEELRLSDELSAAARSLHREWESPSLWPRIHSQMSREGKGPESFLTIMGKGSRLLLPWWRPAVACALALAILSPLGWYAWRGVGPWAVVGSRPASGDRLLSEQALSQVERAEADYIRAIDALSARATERLAEPASPLLMNLRERLIVIDAAIAECRAALDRNRFNAHLRRELLSIYREKQRTLEQMLESAKDVS